MRAMMQPLPTVRPAPADHDVPEPGVYADVPFDVYVGWPAVNNSSLTPLLRSPAHYRQAQANPITPSEAMQLGSLVHAGRLEPAALQERYVAIPDFAAMVRTKDGEIPKNPRATSEYKQLVADFERANSDKQIVSLEQFERMLGVVGSLCRSRRALEYLTGGEQELSLVWIDAETGLLCKGRLDHWCERTRRASDLKTTRDAADFPRFIAQLHYDRQAAFYLDGLATLGLAPREFCIVAVETEAPFGVRSAPVSAATIESGRRKYRDCLRTLAEARSSGDWRGYVDPVEWESARPYGDRGERLLIGGGEFRV